MDQQYQILKCIKSNQLETTTMKTNTSLHQQSLISEPAKTSPTEMIWKIIRLHVRNMIMDQQYQILRCIKSDQLEAATTKINTSLHQQSLISLSLKPSLIEMIRRMVQPYVRNMITDQQYQILECIKSNPLERATMKINTSLHQQYQILECIKSNPLER